MHARLALAALVLASGCGDTFISTDSDGRLEVVISSSGSGAGGDGFSITVDGGTAAILVQGGRTALTGLSPGPHTVLLGGLGTNCGVIGANPRTVTVGSDGTAAVTFEVYCERATTGGLAIHVSTFGQPGDTDGYLLVVGEGGVRGIASNASETFTGLPEGVHLVMLKNVAPGCALEGGNPQRAVVEIGKTAPVKLVVRCGGGTR
ncbi:MAG TPA: hypothetical protein VFG66_17675 [Gemmatimonadales bacterium]|nr:hypothetical protein [Gemmatimonadales bacterium]